MRLAPAALATFLSTATAAGCSGGGGGGGTGAPGASGVCTYPAGPYGTDVGAVVDPSLAWQGYVDDAAQPTRVSVTDFFDCDGSRGVRALVLDESATWCSDCQQQAQAVAPLLGTTWKDQGVRYVTLMAQDQQTDPATLDTAQSWRNEYSLTTGAVCADPQWTLKLWGGAPSSGNGFPTDVVVDPRTMKIVAIQPADLQGTVDNVAAANR